MYKRAFHDIASPCASMVAGVHGCAINQHNNSKTTEYSSGISFDISVLKATM
jgi:hypothetical protein